MTFPQIYTPSYEKYHDGIDTRGNNHQSRPTDLSDYKRHVNRIKGHTFITTDNRSEIQMELTLLNTAIGNLYGIIYTFLENITF